MGYSSAMAAEPDPTTGDVLVVAGRIADEVLFPAAQEVDRSDRVPAGHLAELAAAGLFGVAGPPATGESDIDVATFRRLFATIAGGCGATFFVWAQHHGVLRTVATSLNERLRRELLPKMCAGQTIAGVAFAHLRRAGPSAVGAERVDGGWRIHGHAPWATSWGIADLFAVAAESEQGEVVWALLRGPTSIDVRSIDGAGVTASPLALPVLTATSTVALTFDGWFVPEDDVLAIENSSEWRRADRVRASIGQTAVIGVAERAIRLVEESSTDDAAFEAADRLRRDLDRRWADETELLAALGSGGPTVDAAIAQASAHRAACLVLGQRATTAYLASVGGRGMELGHPAQRLARESDFYVIQAQTADGRAGTLRSI